MKKLLEFLSTAYLLALMVIGAGIGHALRSEDPGIGGLITFVGFIYLSYTLYWSFKNSNPNQK